jgi:hypothetical protein
MSSSNGLFVDLSNSALTELCELSLVVVACGRLENGSTD